MKKKALILLASAVMGLGLVGGTLAAWAVTDNADPLNIGISPGKISTDGETTYITLSWGSEQSISTVSNLKIDETRRAGVLDLRADTAATTVAVTGKFRRKITGDAELLPYVNVDVYKGDIKSYETTGKSYAVNDLVIYNHGVYKCTAAITAPANAFDNEKWSVDVSKKVSFEASPDAQGYDYKNLSIDIKNDSNPYTVLVYLSTISQSDYDTLREAGKKVNVTFDWGIGSTEQTVTATTIYYKGLSTPHVYAFKGDEVVNAKWPGVEMNPAKVSGYYTYELDVSKYDTIIFNDGGTGVGHQTADIPVATLLASSHNCCETAADGTNPTYKTHDDTALPEFWIMGKNLTVGGVAIDWDDGSKPSGVKLDSFVIESGTTVTVVTDGNAELKFHDTTSGVWYSNDGNNFTLGLAGTYDLTFKPNGTPVIEAVKK